MQPTAELGPHDVRNILTADEIHRLRQGYSMDDMLVAARAGVAAKFSPAEAWVEYVLGEFYAPTRAPRHCLSGQEVETVVLGVLASRGSTVELAIHVYWGMCEGLSIDKIAETILLAATYSGMPVLNQSMSVVSDTLSGLKVLVAELKTPPSSLQVVRRLGQMYATVDPQYTTMPDA